jgi:septum formation protein
MMQPGYIYLASQSPRRSELLLQAGIAHKILPMDPAEDLELLETRQGHESPLAYVQRVAALKLDAAVQRLKRLGLEDAPVLCADTTVALGSSILGKPGDANEARAMLTRLSGRTHRVHTALALARKRRRTYALSSSSVSFCVMDAAQIRAYASSGEPMGKAGAYAVQGRAAMFISRISGSYSGIMGLPLFETRQALTSLGFWS